MKIIELCLEVSCNKFINALILIICLLTQQSRKLSLGDLSNHQNYISIFPPVFLRFTFTDAKDAADNSLDILQLNG